MKMPACQDQDKVEDVLCFLISSWLWSESSYCTEQWTFPLFLGCCKSELVNLMHSRLDSLVPMAIPYLLLIVLAFSHCHGLDLPL